MSLVASTQLRTRETIPEKYLCTASVILCVTLRTFECEYFSKQKKARAIIE